MLSENKIRDKMKEVQEIIDSKNEYIKEMYMGELTNMYDAAFADIAINDITIYQAKLHMLQWVLEEIEEDDEN